MLVTVAIYSILLCAEKGMLTYMYVTNESTRLRTSLFFSKLYVVYILLRSSHVYVQSLKMISQLYNLRSL